MDFKTMNMRKILFILIASFAISCTNNGVTVTFDDEKSNAIRAHYQNYLNNDIDGLKSLWSPDLKIYMNIYLNYVYLYLYIQI